MTTVVIKKLEAKLIAHSYYLTQISGFCNMHDLNCVLEIAKKMRLTEFVERYSEKNKGKPLYGQEMLIGYQVNVLDLVEETDNRYSINKDLIEVRKEIENERSANKVKAKKRKGRRRSKTS